MLMALQGACHRGNLSLVPRFADCLAARAETPVYSAGTVKKPLTFLRARTRLCLDSESWSRPMLSDIGGPTGGNARYDTRLAIQQPSRKRGLIKLEQIQLGS
jgi:hypothetical protein